MADKQQDFWEWLTDYIDCDECMFYESCKRIKAFQNRRIITDECCDELRRNYEELKEDEEDD